MPMLVRTDPFREWNSLADDVFGTRSRPAVMPMDAWREGDSFVVEFDVPGVSPESIDIDVERNVLTVKAERPPREEADDLLAAERVRGLYRRQLVLGDTLDTDGIQARYADGVLRLTIPVAAQAKPRRIEIQSGSPKMAISA